MFSSFCRAAWSVCLTVRFSQEHQKVGIVFMWDIFTMKIFNISSFLVRSRVCVRWCAGHTAIVITCFLYRNVFWYSILSLQESSQASLPHFLTQSYIVPIHEQIVSANRVTQIYILHIIVLKPETTFNAMLTLFNAWYTGKIKRSCSSFAIY